jgi:hypothetical protein
MVILKKDAQKGIKDPIQQQLRQMKKQWSKDTSVLIAQLIAFKRGLNGRGDPKAGLPPSNIKDSLPKELEIYMNQMVSRFEDITSRADKIINTQEEYSQKRRKSRSELQETGVIPQQQPEAQPIAAAADYEIKKQARVIDRSGPGSRIWAWVSQYPWFSGKENEIERERLRLMYAIADFENQTNDIEYVLTSFDKNANTRAFYEFSRFLILFERRFIEKFNKALNMQVEYFKDNKENIGPPPAPPVKDQQLEEIKIQKGEEARQEQDTSEKNKREVEQKEGVLPDYTPSAPQNAAEAVSKEPSQNDWTEMAQKAQQVSNDMVNIIRFEKAFQNIPGAEDKLSISSIKEDYNEIRNLAMSILKKVKKKDPTNLLDEYEKMVSIYTMLLKNIASELDIQISDGITLEHIANVLSTKQAAAFNLILKAASKKKFERWFQRLRLSLYTSEFEKSRLEAAKTLRDLADTMDIVQYLLEKKGTLLIEVIPYVRQMYLYLEELCNHFVYIGKYHNYMYGKQRAPGDKPTVGELNTGHIRYLERFSVILGSKAAELESISLDSESGNE